MKIKKEYVILVAIILSMALYLILRNPDKTHYKLPKVPHVAKTDISKIEISKLDTTIVLKRKDNKWHIAPEGYLANTDEVEEMLDSMEKLFVIALVSESKNYSRYDLDDDKKITVKAWEGEALRRDFDVGKTASSYQHTFLKLSGDDRVYHARGNFRGNFDQTVESLRDKTVLSFNRSEIQEIQIYKDKEVIAFNRTQVPVKVSTSKEDDADSQPETESKTVWRTADGKEGDETKLNRLLNTLSDLHCEKYIDNQKKEDFTDPVYTFQLKGTQEYDLSIFAKKDKGAKSYPAVSSENDYPFLLPEWQTKNLITKPGEMLKKPEKP